MNDLLLEHSGHSTLERVILSLTWKLFTLKGPTHASQRDRFRDDVFFDTIPAALSAEA